MDRSDMKLHQRSTWSQCETECQWPWRCPNYLTLYRIHDRLALLGFGRHQDFTERYANSFISFSIDYLDTVPTHKLSKSTYGFGRKTTLTFMYLHPAIHWGFFSILIVHVVVHLSGCKNNSALMTVMKWHMEFPWRGRCLCDTNLSVNLSRTDRTDPWTRA